MGSDKRKRIRVSMVAAAVVKPNMLDSQIEAYMINLSYGGAGIYVKVPLDGRVQLVISLRIGMGKPVAESVWGNVIWKRPVGSKYAVGIAFEGLNPKDHQMLLSFLDRAVRQ
jgi:hypothetical protein